MLRRFRASLASIVLSLVLVLLAAGAALANTSPGSWP